jgi:hypothetical protein
MINKISELLCDELKWVKRVTCLDDTDRQVHSQHKTGAKWDLLGACAKLFMGANRNRIKYLLAQAIIEYTKTKKLKDWFPDEPSQTCCSRNLYIIMLFNDHDQVKFPDIQAVLNIARDLE